MFVLDTDHVSLLEGVSAQSERLRERLHQASEPVATTIVTYEEQTRGWLAQVARARSLAQLVRCYGKLKRHLQLYQSIEVLDFDLPTATKFEELRKMRLRVGTLDLRIAAVAQIRGAVLLSRNRGDFARVPGLRIEDWTL